MAIVISFDLPSQCFAIATSIDRPDRTIVQSGCMYQQVSRKNRSELGVRNLKIDKKPLGKICYFLGKNHTITLLNN